MLDASAPGEAILDNFGGSGTTLIAAEETDRTAFFSELSPAFVDVALERFNALGGVQAPLEGTGQTFAEVQAERLAPPAAER
jgi:DNA modification methylase